MQILGLIAVISWIVMGAAATEVSRAMGKQVCIGRLFSSMCHLEHTKTIKQSQQCGALVLFLFGVLCLLLCLLPISTHTTAHQ